MIFVIIVILKILVLNITISLNGCHDLMQEALNFNDVAVAYVKGSDYRIHFCYFIKDDAINIMNNSNLTEKNGSLQMFLIVYKKSVIQLTIKETEIWY